jgi:hypothetical protein
MTVEEMNALDLSYTPPLGSPWDAVHLRSPQWRRSALISQATGRNLSMSLLGSHSIT